MLIDTHTEDTHMNYHVPIYRVSLVRDGSVTADKHSLTSTFGSAMVLMEFLEGTDREHFVVMMLDRRHKIIGINTVSVGTLDASVVHPREVFKPAVLCNASVIIIGHNHPSGDVSPSEHDNLCTERIKKAGNIMGIKLLDHIIIGDNCQYYSYADNEKL